MMGGTIPESALERFRKEVAEFICHVCGCYAWYTAPANLVSCPTCRYFTTPDEYKAWRDHGTIPPGVDLGRLYGLPAGRRMVRVPCPLSPPDDPHEAHYGPDANRFSCPDCQVGGSRAGFDRLRQMAERLRATEAHLRASKLLAGQATA